MDFRVRDVCSLRLDGAERMKNAIRRLTCAALASVIVVTNFGSSHAAGALDFDQRSASPAGAGVMLNLRVPFGGKASTSNQAYVALTAGPVWHEREATPASPSRFHHVPTIELGRSLSGQPIARLGGIDLASTRPAPMAAEGEERDTADEGAGAGQADGGANGGANGGRTLLLIGLGVLGAIGIAAMVDWARDCKDVPYCGVP